MSTILVVAMVAIITVAAILALSVGVAYYILKDPMLQDPKRGDRQ